MEVIVKVNCGQAVIEVIKANLIIQCPLDELADTLREVQSYCGNPY